MNTYQFIEQIQFLMHIQQIKHYELLIKSNNYWWLTYKRCALTFMTAKDEFFMRQISDKLSPEQRIKIINQIMSLLEEHPYIQTDKIPEMCSILLNKFHTINVVNETTFLRKSSFRKSLRKFGLFSNKVEPVSLLNLCTSKLMKRNATFNDCSAVYCISH